MSLLLLIICSFRGVILAGRTVETHLRMIVKWTTSCPDSAVPVIVVSSPWKFEHIDIYIYTNIVRHFGVPCCSARWLISITESAVRCHLSWSWWTHHLGRLLGDALRHSSRRAQFTSHLPGASCWKLGDSGLWRWPLLKMPNTLLMRSME